MIIYLRNPRQYEIRLKCILTKVKDTIVYDGENKDCKYKLYSVINHIGNFGDGHYFTFSNVGDKWYCFNDENVEEIEKTSVSNKYAYILFYKKCN